MATPATYSAHIRTILALGLPLIGGHIAQIMIGITDTVMLGWYGVDALAAVTLGSSYFFALFIFGSGAALAVMPMVASFAAEGDQIGLRRATRMGMWLSTGFGLLALPLMIWSAPVLRLLGQDAVLAENVSSYLSVAGYGIVPALLVMVLKSYLAALERTQVVLWITVVAALVNGLANYMLIFGNWGAPELGLKGAAYASVLSQIAALIGVVLYAIFALPEHALFQRLWRADTQMMWRVFKLGMPIGLTLLCEVGLFSATAVLMGWLGTVPLAAHGIAVQLSAITFMVHLGLSNVATIRAGNAFGRRDAFHMRRGGVAVTVMSLVFALLTIVVFLAIPEPLLSLFMQDNEPQKAEIIAIGVGLLALAALFQLVDGLQVISLGLLRGVQDTRMPMIIAAISYWCIGIPCSYILGFKFGLGAIGVWMGLVTGLGAAAILLSWRFWLVMMGRLWDQFAQNTSIVSKTETA